MADLISGAALPAFTKQDELKYFLQPMFLGGDDTAMFNVVTDAKSSYSLQQYAALDKVTVAQADGFTGSSSSATAQRTITLTNMNAEVEQSGSGFFGKIDGELLKRGIDRQNVEGTVLAEIIISIFTKGILRDKNRQFWFADTASGDADYSAYDGIMKKLDSLPAGQKLVFPTTLAADVADDQFILMKAAAPNEMLENMDDVVILATRAVVENYLQTLKALGSERAHIITENGMQTLYWDGIEVKAMPEWDTHLLSGAADTGILGNTNPHRAIMTVKQNIEVATDFDNYGLEAWYNKDLQKYRLRADYTIGTNYRNDELSVINYAA